MVNHKKCVHVFGIGEPTFGVCGSYIRTKCLKCGTYKLKAMQGSSIATGLVPAQIKTKKTGQIEMNF